MIIWDGERFFNTNKLTTWSVGKGPKDCTIIALTVASESFRGKPYPVKYAEKMTNAIVNAIYNENHFLDIEAEAKEWNDQEEEKPTTGRKNAKFEVLLDLLQDPDVEDALVAQADVHMEAEMEQSIRQIVKALDDINNRLRKKAVFT